MGNILPSKQIGDTILPETSIWITHIRPILLMMFETTSEIGRLFPDSIIFGSFLLFFMTQNLPYGIFALFMIETSAFHKFTSFLVDRTGGGSDSNSKSTKNTAPTCIPGFRGARLEFERSFLSHSYPSAPMFFLGSIASYFILVNSAFKETMDEMGKDWQMRFSFGIAMILIWCVTAIGLRGFFGCDPFGEIGLAFLIGLCIGICMYFINTRVFGMEAVNFLGLPYLVSKTDEKNPLYICTNKNGLV